MKIETSNLAHPGAIVGACAALAASAGDILELYVGNAARPELGLHHPPDFVLWLGGLLGFLSLPMFGFGYRAVARSFEGHAPKLARLTTVAGFATGFVGAVVHGYTAVLIDRQLQAGSAGGDPSQAILAAGPTLLWLWAAVALGLIVASAAFVAGHGRRFGFTHPLTLLNPLLLTLILIILGSFGIWARAFLQPAAPNLAHLLFFALFLRLHRTPAAR